MFTQKDERKIVERGSNLAVVSQQIEYFRRGFPFLPVVEAASAGDGIISVTEEEAGRYVKEFDEATLTGLSILKFVPASGAASRMFKSLFEALEAFEAGKSESEILNNSKDTREFLEHIADFAFYDALVMAIHDAGQPLSTKNLLDYLLNDKGLGYGKLPKGLLLFHKYDNLRRTPFEEHLAEGANYARDYQGVVRLHFTVSPEHESSFRELLSRVKKQYENFFHVTYEVGFSTQKPSTDTIAVDPDNEPFRKKNGSLLFRPGGHGALLANLNDLDNDLIFIKNIDNVVPDRLKPSTYTYKKVLAGVLLHYQKHIFTFQKELDRKSVV